MGNTLSSGGGEARPKLKHDEVSQLPLVQHVVYAMLCEHVYNEPDRRPLPPGWRILMSCDEVQLDREGYYATAYINESINHCVIAERGTSDALGIRAGIWMYFDEPTIQFALAEQFSKLVRLRLSLLRSSSLGSPASSTGGFDLSYTGHSLGSVLAACRACAEHTFAVTFESPGAKLFVEKTMHPFKGDDVDVITYLRPPNPINTLKPQCGYLVQLPYTGPSATPGGVAQPVKKSTFGASLPNPHDYLRNKLLEKSIPELGNYMSKIEPIVKELVEHTHQVHSISNIVADFQRDTQHPEPINQDVVLRWPNHIMQFLEFFNISKAMDDPINQSTHAYNAYLSLLNKLYRTSKRNIFEVPLRFLNKDSLTLVRLWCVLTPAHLSGLPVSPLERKALNTISIESDTLVSSVLTAFQMKQLLSLITQRPQVHAALDSFSEATPAPMSKL